MCSRAGSGVEPWKRSRQLLEFPLESLLSNAVTAEEWLATVVDIWKSLYYGLACG